MVRRRLLLARPDACAQHAEQSLIVGVDGHDRVNEKASYIGVPGRPEPSNRLTGAIEVDLRGVLRSNDASASASLDRACHVRHQQRVGIDIIR